MIGWWQGTSGGDGDLRSCSDRVVLRLDCSEALGPSSWSFCRCGLNVCGQEEFGPLFCPCWWVFLVSPECEDCAFGVFSLCLWGGFNFIKHWSSGKPSGGTPRVGRSDRQPEHPSAVWDAGCCPSCRFTRGQSKRRAWGLLALPPVAAWAGARGCLSGAFPQTLAGQESSVALLRYLKQNETKQTPSDQV